ncbi:MAG: DNA-directed RNA polymerase subunit beta' [bacterium]|nr:DNA-directed RNA polymerase subunit beta' [bacterium]
MFHEMETKTLDFDALRLRLASPERMREWSHGEVTKAETVNYRTQKPEKDGLFDERIFGPSKDWECYCGKYKKVRYKGIVCDKCGVEVTRSVVRRERMGHIELASPVSHIWFLRGVPSRIGLLLDLSLQNLEKVVYFASFIVTRVDEDAKKLTLEQIRQEYKAKKKKFDEDFNRQAALVRQQVAKAHPSLQGEALAAKVDEDLHRVQKAKEERMSELDSVLHLAEAELKDLKPLKILSEHQYQDLSLKYGHLFEAGIGAEAVRQLLEDMDLEKVVDNLNTKLGSAHGPMREKLTKRLRLCSDLQRNKIRPEWMVLTTIPVIPPDLRPMVPLDGGRFATSDLNDLYRRIINRNNRLKQLVELNAPEVICRNEKRMLQEAVDALIDNNARHGKTVVASTGQKRMLKSLADILRGKQGRFRQNLLGKRIDYSGRSVIVVGPKLKLDQCGLPKKMALELFKPFIISRIIKAEYVHNVRSASRFIDSGRPEVWDILEDIVKGSYVLLNRAPTLHRLGIQAFKPTLIEGKAIQVHPLVCSAFNADFDGDQMAVHVPLTEEAKREAAEIMLSTRNLLKPATGAPITNPTMDMVWGCYYMTMVTEPKHGKPKIFSTVAEANCAYQLRHIKLQEKLQLPAGVIPRPVLDDDGKKLGKSALVTTSMGRVLFNDVLPPDYPFVNSLMDKKSLAKIVARLLERYSFEEAATLLDKIKEFGFKYLTRSGFSWGMDDIPALAEKHVMVEQGDREVAEINDQFEMGLLTDSERHTKVIETWMKIKDSIVGISRKALNPTGPVYTMVESGARGSWSQLIQIMGMKGLVTNPAGDIIELPVKGNFKEGFDVLEYFISTHGARKGLSDTALRTANAGYLTRRLVDVAQDLVISSEDCGDTEGFTFNRADSESVGLHLVDRVINRFSLQEVIPPRARKPLLHVDELITPALAESLRKLDLPELWVRSVLSCKNRRGICQKCYGQDLGYNKLVKMGTAVGIIAAQSIGEPGTQLTMRTFHTGGVAGLDITQGLPRVEEIFEARSPKVKAFVSEVAGKVTVKLVSAGSRQKMVEVVFREMGRDVYPIAPVTKGKGKKKAAVGGAIEVKEGQKVKDEELLGVNAAGEKVLAKRGGTVHVEDGAVVIVAEQDKTKEYIIPTEFTIIVKNGDLVGPGDRLTDGSLDLRQLYRLKGMADTQRYVLREIQTIYTSQGQQLNDKHVELIIRQMFSRVQVKDSGDTPLLASSRLEWTEFVALNQQQKDGKRPADGERLLLGITKVSLSTSSFLSAASFQETSRVLINAAVQGRIDFLEGLKENVIIGRLIPAGTGFRIITPVLVGATPITEDSE